MQFLVKVTQKYVRDRFSYLEDMRLTELVETHGAKDWRLISSMMPGRNPRQVRERWYTYLSPDVNKKPWTEEEESLLIEKQKEFGNKWKHIASFFDKRTDINVKSKYHQLERQQKKKERINGISSPEDPEQTELPSSPYDMDIQSDLIPIDEDFMFFDGENNFSDVFMFL